MKPYEVWCHSCNVTFPPEQKHCLHCGARLRAEPPSGRGRRSREPEFLLHPADLQDAPGRIDRPVFRPADRTTAPASASEAEAEDEEPMRRSLIRAGMTVIWMVLLAAGYAWRACSQQ